MKFASTFKIQNHKNVGDCVFSLPGNLIKDILVAGGIITSSRRSSAGGLVYSQGSWESKIRCLNSFLFLGGGGGFSNIFHVHPAYLVKIPILTDIFQKG